MAEAADAAGTDLFLGGLLRLKQPLKGHRAGTDAVLLAAAAPPDENGFALDIGAGAGAAGLALAHLRPHLSFGLVEKDAATAGFARENLRLNDFERRGRVFEADVLDAESRRAAGLTDGGAQLVITNPPFLDPAQARLSPDPARRDAHAMRMPGPEALAAWIAACLDLLETGGQLILIHRPDALACLLESLRSRAGAITLLAVQAHPGKPATRILLRAKKGSRAPLTIAPALVLHSGGRFSAQAEAIHRGTALIDW